MKNLIDEIAQRNLEVIRKANAAPPTGSGTKTYPVDSIMARRKPHVKKKGKK